MNQDIFTVGIEDDRKHPKSYKLARPWLKDRILRGLTRVGEARISKNYRASEFSVCPRMSVLKAQHMWQGNQTASSRLYTVIGEAIHEAIQDSLYKENLLLFKEYAMEQEVLGTMFTGTCDAIIKDEITPDVSIVDIKSTNDVTAHVKSSYKRQIALYALMLGLPSMDIYYVDRSVGMPEPKTNIVPIEYSYIDTIALDIGIASCLKEGELPKRLRTRADCFYCTFQQRCWDGDIGKGTLSNSTMNEANVIAELLIDTIGERRMATLDKLARVSHNGQWVLDNYEQIKTYRHYP